MAPWTIADVALYQTKCNTIIILFIKKTYCSIRMSTINWHALRSVALRHHTAVTFCHQWIPYRWQRYVTFDCVTPSRQMVAFPASRGVTSAVRRGPAFIPPHQAIYEYRISAVIGKVFRRRSCFSKFHEYQCIEAEAVCGAFTYRRLSQSCFQCHDVGVIDKRLSVVVSVCRDPAFPWLEFVQW